MENLDNLVGKYYRQMSKSAISYLQSLYLRKKHTLSIQTYSFGGIYLYILAVAHRNLNRHPMNDEMGNIDLSQYKL